MVLVCLPSDALLQHLPSYLGFSYLGHGISLHGCSSKAQLDEGDLLTTALPDLQRGIAPLGPPVPAQTGLLPATAPGLGCGVSLPGYTCPHTRGSSSQPLPLTSDLGSSSRPFLRCLSLALSAAAPDLRRGVTPLGRA